MQPARQDSPDDERAVQLLRRLFGSSAMLPPKSAHKKKNVCVKLSPDAHANLVALAAQLGYTYNGHGNLSTFLEAIGTGTVIVTPVAPFS